MNAANPPTITSGFAVHGTPTASAAHHFGALDAAARARRRRIQRLRARRRVVLERELRLGGSVGGQRHRRRATSSSARAPRASPRRPSRCGRAWRLDQAGRGLGLDAGRLRPRRGPARTSRLFGSSSTSSTSPVCRSQPSLARRERGVGLADEVLERGLHRLGRVRTCLRCAPSSFMDPFPPALCRCRRARAAAASLPRAPARSIWVPARLRPASRVPPASFCGPRRPGRSPATPRRSPAARASCAHLRRAARSCRDRGRSGPTAPWPAPQDDAWPSSASTPGGGCGGSARWRIMTCPWLGP